MRRIKRPKIGEYVLVTKYSDKDPQDPWRVGCVSAIMETANTISCMVDDNNRDWYFIYRISQAEGEEWLRLYS